MKLIEQIDNDVKEAMRSKNELALSTLRMLKSSIKNKEIELGHPLSESELGEAIAKSVKQRKDSIIEYEKGQRADLASKEQNEIKILEKYLPKQLSEAEISKIVDEAIKSSGVANIQDMGKLMGLIMPKLKGKADGSLISQIVHNKLG